MAFSTASGIEAPLPENSFVPPFPARICYNYSVALLYGIAGYMPDQSHFAVTLNMTQYFSPQYTVLFL
jgi:hypothetical protein